MGGLGIQSAVQLAPSAFLASAAASSDLVYHIVPPQLQGSPMPHVEDAQRLWAKGHDRAPPEGVAQNRQKAWDTLRASASAEALLENAPDPRSRARLLASMTKESGTWLDVLPISSLGLRMDDNTIRVAVGLCLGAALCSHIHVTIAELKWTASLHVDSAVGGVKVATTVMLPYYTQGSCLSQKSHPA